MMVERGRAYPHGPAENGRLAFRKPALERHRRERGIRRPSALGVHSCDAGEANRQQWKWIKRHCFLDYRACGWDAAECHAVSVVLLRGDYRIHFNGHGLGINGSGDGHPMARELFRRLLIA